MDSFHENEVGAQEAFDSHFMSDYLRRGMINHARNDTDGKTAMQVGMINHAPTEQSLFAAEPLAAKAIPNSKIIIQNKKEPPLSHLSEPAKAVMEAGRKLWHYYHEQPGANPNASLYDIRLHFQGYKTTKSGKVQMNAESSDETYIRLITALRDNLKNLAATITPKVYKYGFLLGS